MAARQKMKEIEKCNLEWDRRKAELKEEIAKTISKREDEQRRIDQIHDQIEKLNELLQQSSDNIKRLKE
jgi:K+/H+ antiporter YhaU regulatory subunit KhtT